MTEPYVSVNGHRATTATITIPWYGAWVADVALAITADVSNPVTLTVGNLSLQGALFRQASFAGTRTMRMVAGAGGWGKTLPAAAYQNITGVRLSTVLGDAALLTGETLSLAQDRVLGTSFVRASGPAQRLLRLLAGSTWWIDSKGVTQVNTRSTFKIRGQFNVISWSGERGQFVIATESVAEWLPGGIFTAPTVPDPQTVGMTTIQSNNEGTLRLTVLSAGTSR